MFNPYNTVSNIMPFPNYGQQGYSQSGYTQPNYNPMTKQDIVRVNGENGARTFQMYPNSSALLLDENNPIVWLVQTDGAGYKTVTAYSITPYEPNQPVNLSNIEMRLNRLEEIVNAKSYSSNAKQAEQGQPEYACESNQST